MTDNWKETVRLIYDVMHGMKYKGKDVGIFRRLCELDDTARAVIEIIEDRHPEYFCGKVKTMGDWENKDNTPN